MITFDSNYVQGYPLQYGCAVTSTFWTDYYSYTIGKYLSQQTVEMSEEVLMPLSSNDPQSDSDNSVSSVDISTTDGTRSQINPDDIKCCWKSCGLWFRSLDKLSNHITKLHASSGPGGLFYCGWDGCPRNLRGFNARYKMLVHVRTHTNERPHQCTECQKSFSRAENLKIHFRSHSGEKPYVCPVPGCNKAYSNSSDRFKHTRTHQVEKPYSCKVPGCFKRYTDPSSLRKHVKTYRHFVDTVLNQKEPEIKEQTNEKHVTDTSDKHHYIQMDAPLSPPLTIDSLYINQTDYCDSINGVCKCTHTCNNYLNGSAKEMLHFDNVLESDRSLPSWRQFWNTSIEINRNGEKTFFIDELKESDMPLDLSISRH